MEKMRKVKYYDIGLNLFCKQFPDPEAIVRNAAAAGVCCILTGTDRRENQKIDQFVRNHDVFGTAGIHPHNADSARKEDFEQIERLITKNDRILAVGECGLDFDRMFSSKENQIRCLEKHIVLAERLHKPLFLHERSAADEFIEIFKKHLDICKKSVVHCFTGDRKTLEQYLSMGFSIGITGWICDDRRGKELREAVKSIPLDRILIETDAPYLTPRNVPGLGRINVPENVVYVARELAKYRKVDEEELVLHARQNTERIFGISGQRNRGDLDRASKFISLILRHQPEAAGITLDEHGWADVEELIAGIQKTRIFDRETLEEIVRTDDKQRYSFSQDKRLIRANQGHSIPVDVELPITAPPEYLYHGTGQKYVESIDRTGLIPKSRLYVHLSGDLDTAVKVGRRHGRPVVYRVDSGRMQEDGYVFYRSVNGVWLTKTVPVEYMEKNFPTGAAGEEAERK